MKLIGFFHIYNTYWSRYCRYFFSSFGIWIYQMKWCRAAQKKRQLNTVPYYITTHMIFGILVALYVLPFIWNSSKIFRSSLRCVHNFHSLLFCLSVTFFAIILFLCAALIRGMSLNFVSWPAMQNLKFYFAFLLLKQMCIFAKQKSMNGKKYTQSRREKKTRIYTKNDFILKTVMLLSLKCVFNGNSILVAFFVWEGKIRFL